MISREVQEALDEATGSLRNALYKAAKNERSSVLKQIGDVISHIESIGMTDNLLDKLDKYKNDRNDSGLI